MIRHVRQTRIVDAFKHEGVSISFLDDNSFIVNTDCCTLDTREIEGTAALIDILQSYERMMSSRIHNCRTLRQVAESEIADYIFTELPAVQMTVEERVEINAKWVFKSEDIGRMFDMIHCDNCDEHGTHCHFKHPEDDNPIYLCDRCLAGETHE